MTGSIAAVATGYRHAFDFTGRATRSEFWWFVAFTGVVNWIVQYAWLIGDVLGFVAMVQLVLLVPLSACLARRVRDTGRHPVWALPAIVLMLAWPVALLVGIDALLAESIDAGETTGEGPDSSWDWVGIVYLIVLIAPIPAWIFCFFRSAPVSGADVTGGG